MNWRKLSSLLILAFIVSIGSSLTTWYVLTHREQKQISWKELLKLTPEQEKTFSALEAEFNTALKDIETQDAQDKMKLCSYLHTENMTPEEMKPVTKKMAENYEAKQEKIAMTLAAITRTLTPEQRKTFTNTLMHEICVSCKKATGMKDCLCGMCERHT